MVKWSMRSWRGNRQALIQTLNCVSDNRPILLHHLDFYDPGEFPTPSSATDDEIRCCRSTGSLNLPLRFVVPQEITSHANFLRLVCSRLAAVILKPGKSSKRLNPHVVAVDSPLRPWRNLTNDWRRIADSRCVIAKRA